jgi:hypothetical protein
VAEATTHKPSLVPLDARISASDAARGSTAIPGYRPLLYFTQDVGRMLRPCVNRKKSA